jgi:hypothetical protein
MKVKKVTFYLQGNFVSVDANEFISAYVKYIGSLAKERLERTFDTILDDCANCKDKRILIDESVLENNVDLSNSDHHDFEQIYELLERGNTT